MFTRRSSPRPRRTLKNETRRDRDVQKTCRDQDVLEDFVILSHRHQGPLRGSLSNCGALSRRGLTQLNQHTKTTHVGRMAGTIATSAFNRLGQYASSPGNRAYCYAELAVSSPAVAEIITSTHCAYQWRDGQTE